MKSIAHFLMVAVLAATGGLATASGDNPLANTRWNLVSFTESSAEVPALEGAGVMIEFRTDGRAGGSGGCNSFGGEYTIQGSELTFGPLMSTKRACVDAGWMRQEQRFFQALHSARAFELAGDTLKVSYDEGKGVLTFVKAKPVSATAAKR
jgi:heat shock protein HslJ